MAIKPNFLASMGYQYFLSYGALIALLEVERLPRNETVEIWNWKYIIQAFLWRKTEAK